MEKLIELGFRQSAVAEFVNGDLVIKILQNEHSTNLLYAFVLINGDEIENWHVRYIGHTRKTFKNRMYGYQQGNGVAVNNRVHNEIKKHCIDGKKMVIYSLSEIYNLNLHNLYIDVAAGLEYALIEYYQNYNSSKNHPPLLNIAGNKQYVISENQQSENLAIEEKKEEELQYSEELIVLPKTPIVGSFEQRLSLQTYWENPSINVPIEFSELFTDHDDMATLIIKKNDKIIKAFSIRINRTANANKTPRLYILGIDGKWFQSWKQNNFTRNDTIKFKITAENNLLIEL